MSNIPSLTLTEDDPYAYDKSLSQFEEETPNVFFYPYRIFMNRIDSYHGNAISKYLASKRFGENPYSGEDISFNNLDLEKEKHYEIVGTAEASEIRTRKLEHVHKILHPDQDDYYENILKCKFIIFDISSDADEIEEATQTLAMLDKNIEDNPNIPAKENVYYILISSFMTWAKTKKLDSRSKLPLRETDYRKRRTHINFQQHIELEKEVATVGIKHKGKKLRVAIVACGAVYGGENQVFEYAFKMAFNNYENIPVFLPGNNIIPTIHLQDLAVCIFDLIVDPPTGKKKYFLAVEPSNVTLKNAIKTISKSIGYGKIELVPQEHAFFLPIQIDQRSFDQLVANVPMQPGRFSRIHFQHDLGFIGLGKKLAYEFRQMHGLDPPIRILLSGPPGSGKTELAKMLAEHYGAHHLTVKSVIHDKIEKLKRDIAILESQVDVQSAGKRIEEEHEAETEGEDFEGEPKMDLRAMKNLLQEVEDNIAADTRGRLTDSYVISFFKEALLSPPCQNQGYILDGWPKTLSQAIAVFGSNELGNEGAGEDGNEDILQFDERIMPDNIFGLEASDYFLCRRIMELPQCEVEGTHYTEDEMLRRLSEFRSIDNYMTSPLIFFDDNERHPKLIKIEELESLDALFAIVCERVGSPRRFIQTHAERQKELLDKNQKQEEEQKARDRKEQGELDKLRKQREEAMEEWTKLFEKLRAEEEALLASQGAPLRHYLTKYVLPTLTRGMLEVARIRPADPIDYLAEYLFRENPEGKAFDPAWNANMHELERCAKFVIKPHQNHGK